MRSWAIVSLLFMVKAPHLHEVHGLPKCIDLSGKEWCVTSPVHLNDLFKFLKHTHKILVDIEQ